MSTNGPTMEWFLCEIPSVTVRFTSDQIRGFFHAVHCFHGTGLDQDFFLHVIVVFSKLDI